jgi:spore germination protein KC
MITRYKNIVFILLLPLLLTGCWDYNDINKRSISISIGVDDVNGNVEFTGENAKLRATSSQKESSAQTISTYTFRSLGKNFEESRGDYDAKMPGQYFAGATRCIVFSRKYAKKGIEFYINRLSNIAGFRDSVLVTVSKERPRDLFRKKVENDICIGYAIQDTIKYLDDNGVALYKTVSEINSDINFKSIGYFLPYVTVNKNTVKYLGLAAMKGSKLIGIVKRKDSNGILFLLSTRAMNTRFIQSPRNNKNLISIKTKLAKRSITTSYGDKKINIFIDLKLKSQIQYEKKTQPINKQDIKKIENIISSKIKKAILSATNSSKNKFKSDVFGFARYFKADNYQVYKHIDWNKEYPKAVFHVNVNTIIVNTNLLDLNAKKPN